MRTTLIELMNSYSKIYGEVRPACDVAKRHLRMRLCEGPVSATIILRNATIKGISHAALRRAKDDLGIIAKKDGPPNASGESTWQWRLPAKEIRRIRSHIGWLIPSSPTNHPAG